MTTDKQTEKKPGFLARVFSNNKDLDSSLLLITFTGAFITFMFLCRDAEYAKSEMANNFADIFKIAFPTLLAFFFKKTTDNGG